MTPSPPDTSNSAKHYISHIKSTPGHRKSQRFCAMSEVMNQAIAPSTASGSLLIKLSQVAISTQAFFKPNTKPIEKIAHGIQASIAISQFTLNTILFFNQTDCIVTQNTLCDALSYLNILYSAILITGWGSAEALKEPHDESESTSASVAPSEELPSEASFNPQRAYNML